VARAPAAGHAPLSSAGASGATTAFTEAEAPGERGPGPRPGGPAAETAQLLCSLPLTARQAACGGALGCTAPNMLVFSSHSKCQEDSPRRQAGFHRKLFVRSAAAQALSLVHSLEAREHEAAAGGQEDTLVSAKHRLGA
jgi:hypothetical protein